MKRAKVVSLFLCFWMLLAAGASAEEIHFQSPDGISLTGTLNSVSNSKGTVILIHMLNRTREDWQAFAAFLNQKGWTTLAFDLRGHGQSRGDEKKEIDWKDFSKDDFLTMIKDLEGAFQFLTSAQNPHPQNIFIIGASIGANLSVEFAAKNEAVRGVVLLSPGVDYRGVKPKRAVMDYKERPLLIAASEEDTFSFTSSDFLYQLAPTPEKEFVKIKAGGHGTEMLEDPALGKKILEFLEKR